MSLIKKRLSDERAFLAIAIKRDSSNRYDGPCSCKQQPWKSPIIQGVPAYGCSQIFI